jgi:ArsR family transcriptional regulator
VQAGVLSRERHGTWSWYRIDNAAIDTLAAALAPGGPLRDTGSCCD